MACKDGRQAVSCLLRRRRKKSWCLLGNHGSQSAGQVGGGSQQKRHPALLWLKFYKFMVKKKPDVDIQDVDFIERNQKNSENDLCVDFLLNQSINHSLKWQFIYDLNLGRSRPESWWLQFRTTACPSDRLIDWFSKHWTCFVFLKWLSFFHRIAIVLSFSEIWLVLCLFKGSFCLCSLYCDV